MTEPVLRDYFQKKASYLELLKDYNKKPNKIRAYYKMAEMIDTGNFIVSNEHLIMLCDDVLMESDNFELLESVSFMLHASEFFDWNDNRVVEVLDEWCSPEINYPLTKENIFEWKNYLLGNNREMKISS